MAQAPLPIYNKPKYILKINIEEESIIFNLSKDGEFDTLSYMNKMTLNEIKQISNSFQGIYSLKNFSDFIEKLNKEKKLNYKKNKYGLSITFNHEYCLSIIPIEIQLLTETNYLFELKIKNIQEQLKDYQNKQDIKNNNIKKFLKKDINMQNEEINKLKEQNKQLIEEIKKIKQMIGDDKRLKKNNEEGINEELNIKNMEIEEIKKKKEEKEFKINNQKQITKELEEIKNKQEELKNRINNQEEKGNKLEAEMKKNREEEINRKKEEEINRKKIEEIYKRVEEGEARIKKREEIIKKKLDDMNLIKEHLVLIKNKNKNEEKIKEENKRNKEFENKREKEDENKKIKEKEFYNYKGLNKEDVESLLTKLNLEFNILNVIDENQLRSKIIEFKCNKDKLDEWIINDF